MRLLGAAFGDAFGDGMRSIRAKKGELPCEELPCSEWRLDWLLVAWRVASYGAAYSQARKFCVSPGGFCRWELTAPCNVVRV